LSAVISFSALRIPVAETRSLDELESIEISAKAYSFISSPFQNKEPLSGFKALLGIFSCS
jgi:hypothetical protein